MSHVEIREARLTDLDAIKRACKRLGWDFRENQKTFDWFGEHVGDTDTWRKFFTEGELEALDRMTERERLRVLTDTFSRCDHAISVPDCSYEIGLVQTPTGYKVVYDAFEDGGLQNVFNEANGDPLAQAYAVEKAGMIAEENGYEWKAWKNTKGEYEVLVETGT